MHVISFNDFLKESQTISNQTIEGQKLIPQIQKVLTPDLLKGMWKTHKDKDFSPMSGHCYAATSALWWMLGAMESEYTPFVLSKRNYPELFDGNESHWYLMNKRGQVLDVTVEQFGDHKIDYSRGIANGMMVHPFGGCKRARTIIDRVVRNREELDEQ